MATARSARLESSSAALRWPCSGRLEPASPRAMFSRIDRSKSMGSCRTSATAPRRRRTSSPAMSCPSRRTVPASASYSRASNATAVDLPLPDAPTIAVCCWAGIASDTDRRTGVSGRDAYEKLTACSSSRPHSGEGSAAPPPSRVPSMADSRPIVSISFCDAPTATPKICRNGATCDRINDAMCNPRRHQPAAACHPTTPTGGGRAGYHQASQGSQCRQRRRCCPCRRPGPQRRRQCGGCPAKRRGRWLRSR